MTPSPTTATPVCRVCRGDRTLTVGPARGQALTCPHCRGTGRTAR